MVVYKSLNRYSAFGIHLFISAFIVSVSAFIVYSYWYPDLLGYASGVGDIFLILILVDVILGPLITLIVFNLQKKELKKDLVVVGCIQFAALFYGLMTMYEARPVFVVFNVGRFDVVYANEIKKDQLGHAVYNEFKSLPLWGPEVIAAKLPEDLNKAKEIIMSAVAGGADLQYMPEYYVPYDEMRSLVVASAKSLSLIGEFNKTREVDVARLIESYASSEVNVGYVPLVGKRKKLVVVVDLSNARILQMSELNPLDASFGVDSINLKNVLKK